MDKPDPRAFADIEDYFAALDEFYAAELYADLIPTAA